jgi:hypothetical protein
MRDWTGDPAGLRALLGGTKRALGWLDCPSGLGDGGGILREKQCLTRLPQHWKCLLDRRHNAMICTHRISPVAGFHAS